MQLFFSRVREWKRATLAAAQEHKRKGRKRGQIGLEYITILALVLGAMGIFIFFVYQETQAGNAISQAKTAVTKIVDSVDLVYAQGPGARTRVRVYFPKNINYASASGREVLLNMFGSGGLTTDVYIVAKGNVSGELPSTEGVYWLTVFMDDEGTVQITTEPSEVPEFP